MRSRQKHDTYKSLFCEPEISDYIAELSINILVFSLDTEEIEQWID
ncbi:MULTISPECIES: hypothetical protein [Spirulina sp. CCY15215]|nr:hypothetical protein [Spirulina major]